MPTLGNVPLILRRALMVAVGIALVGLGGCTDKPVPTGADPTAGPDWFSTPFRLDPLDVIACKYGGTWPDCNLAPAPSGPAAPTSPAGPTGGNEGTSLGGSGGSPNPPTAPGDTACTTTNDAILKDPNVQGGFASLWANSNPTDPDRSKRREQGGWILQNANGSLSVQPFTDVRNEVCAIVPNNGFAPVPPPNAVGWVHTHPMERGYNLAVCGYVDPATGQPVLDPYLGGPSADDILMGNRINQLLAQQGRPMMKMAYVIDHSAITPFVSVAGTGAALPSIPRCGY